jgi:phosphoribosylamine--glycine ligase
MREGHEFSWFLIEEEDHRLLKNTLKGLIPPPLEEPPKFSDFDLILFDSTGHGELADEAAKETPTIGDSSLASRLEDDRLFGIQVMEQCGIEVPPYEVFQNPDGARKFLEQRPKRYVYKPFEPEDPTEHQESDATYVSDSAEDMLRCIEKLFVRALEQPFLLQEVVEGTEVSTEGYFDGHIFHLINHTYETKKLMSGDYGPNTGCSGNLICIPRGTKRLVQCALLPLTQFLRDSCFRGPIDVNTIVNENHAYALELTPRFGYDSDATMFSMLDGDLGAFLYGIAVGEMESAPPLTHDYAASVRYSVPPYPTEVKGKHPRGLPITGIAVEDAWRDCYLYDAESDGEEGLETTGTTGFVCSPIARGNTPEGAWSGVHRKCENLKIPNAQARDDVEENTLKRLAIVRELGWD